MLRVPLGSPARLSLRDQGRGWQRELYLFSTHFSLGSEITGLTALSPFGLSFFSTLACVSSLTPLYSTQLCEFLCVPDGGEHLGN